MAAKVTRFIPTGAPAATVATMFSTRNLECRGHHPRNILFIANSYCQPGERIGPAQAFE